MTLRSRVLLVNVGVIFMFMMGFYVVVTSIILRGFGHIETEEARQNTTRTSNTLLGFQKDLHGRSGDWATWDDSYEYMQDKNNEFVESNIQAASLAELGINGMVFLDRGGNRVMAVAIDTEANKFVPVPESLGTDIARYPVLLDTDDADGTSGLMEIGTQIAMVSSRPIRKSDGSGLPAGTLLFYRYLTDDTITEINEITQSTNTLKRAGNPGIAVENGDSPSVKIVDSDTIFGHVPLFDVNGKSVGTVEIKMDREILDSANNSIRLFSAGIIVFSIIMLLSTFLTQEYILLKPIQILSRIVQGYAINPDTVKDTLFRDKNDEIGTLSRSISNAFQVRNELEGKLKDFNRDMEQKLSDIRR
jgi:sensor domain CHASE-containing protein